MSYPTDVAHGNGWRDNPALGRLLGLCPLLVVATNTVNALLLSIAAAAVLVTSNVFIASIRRFIPDTARLPATMLLIGLCTSTVALLMQTFAFDVYERIAVFMQIVVTNYFTLVRAETAVQERAFGYVSLDSITTAAGFGIVLLIVGATREIVGQGLPLAVLAPGAFLIAGLLLAAANALGRRS